MTWEEVKKQYVGVERAVLLIKTYMELGSFYKVAEKFGTERKIINANVACKKEELMKEYPELYADYRKFGKENKGKFEGRQEYKGEKGDWKEVDARHKGIDRARFIMKESLAIGGLKNMERKYGIKAASMSNIITSYKVELMKNYKEEYTEYLTKGAKRKIKKDKGKLDKDEKFDSRVFKKLSKKVTYDRLRDFLLDYHTGELSGEELVKMASKQGIQVFDMIEGKPKLIRL